MCVISNIRCGMSAVYFHFKRVSLIMAAILNVSVLKM